MMTMASTTRHGNDKLVEQQQEQQPLISPRNNDKLRSSLRNKIYMRRASLTDGEAAFLLGLLIDPPPLPSPQDEPEPLEPSSTSSSSIKNSTEYVLCCAT